MNTFGRNRPNMRFDNPWNQRFRPPNGPPQRRNMFNSAPPNQQPNRGMPMRYISPSNQRFWCETCDKEFKTKAILDNHIQQHQKCNIDGCQFIAHPLVITKHIQMQHSTGLYKRIGSLNNPEDIKKWREERKKKYPTKANIERKQAEIKEKISRGEKMGLKQERRVNRSENDKPAFNRNRQKKFHEKQNRTFGKRKIFTNEIESKKRPPNKKPKINLTVEDIRKLQPFKGIQDLILEDSIAEDTIEQSNELFEDDEEVSEKEKHLESTKPTVCSALSSLMCTYESSDEEIEEKPIETLLVSEKTSNSNTVTQESNKEQQVNTSITCLNDCDNDSGPEEAVINKDVQMPNNEDAKPVKLTRRERLKRQAIVRNKTRVVNLKRKLPSTLLEKLLHKEIQHERNVILQCVRYVVKNNYFDK